MGSTFSLMGEMFPSKPHWTAKDMPDMTGKVVIVTGGNTGVGKETVKGLLAKNAKVYLAARTPSKAEAAILDLKGETGREAIFLKLDLGSLASVRESAKEFLSKEPELHVLFNNAGVMWPPLDQLTSDSFDLQWGTNVIGHWLFTELLMPALLRAAENSSDRKARVVTTSSSAAYFGGLTYETFKVRGEGVSREEEQKANSVRKKMGTQALYFQSKFGNAVVAWEVARRYGDQGIVSTALNPGNLNSDLQRHTSGLQLTIIRWLCYPVWYGALTQLYAGTSPEGAKLNGKWLVPWARLGRGNPKAEDPEVGKKLWAWLEENTREG